MVGSKIRDKNIFANFFIFFNRSGWGKIWFDPNPPLFAHSVCVCLAFSWLLILHFAQLSPQPSLLRCPTSPRAEGAGPGSAVQCSVFVCVS